MTLVVRAKNTSSEWEHVRDKGNQFQVIFKFIYLIHTKIELGSCTGPM